MRGHTVYFKADGSMDWLGHVAPFRLRDVQSIIKGRMGVAEDFDYIRLPDGEHGHECIVYHDVDAARMEKPRNNRAMHHFADPKSVLHGSVIVFYGDDEFLEALKT